MEFGVSPRETEVVKKTTARLSFRCTRRAKGKHLTERMCTMALAPSPASRRPNQLGGATRAHSNGKRHVCARFIRRRKLRARPFRDLYPSCTRGAHASRRHTNIALATSARHAHATFTHSAHACGHRSKMRCTNAISSTKKMPGK